MSKQKKSPLMEKSKKAIKRKIVKSEPSGYLGMPDNKAAEPSIASLQQEIAHLRAIHVLEMELERGFSHALISAVSDLCNTSRTRPDNVLARLYSNPRHRQRIIELNPLDLPKITDADVVASLYDRLGSKKLSMFSVGGKIQTLGDTDAGGSGQVTYHFNKDGMFTGVTADPYETEQGDQ